LQVTLQINEEVHEQNKALDQMHTGMGATDNLLASTLAKMGVRRDSTCFVCIALDDGHVAVFWAWLTTYCAMQNVFEKHGNQSIVKMSGAVVAMFLVVGVPPIVYGVPLCNPSKRNVCSPGRTRRADAHTWPRKCCTVHPLSLTSGDSPLQVYFIIRMGARG